MMQNDILSLDHNGVDEIAAEFVGLRFHVWPKCKKLLHL